MTTTQDAIRLIKQLKVDPSQVNELDSLVAFIQSLGDQLTTLKSLASQKYRRSSEKIDPAQLAMAFIEHLASKPKAEETSAEVPKPDKPKRNKRKSNVKALPVVVVNKEIPENERCCTDCSAVKAPMGFDVRRSLIFKPAKLYIEAEHLTKYVCKTCESGIVAAPAKPKLVEGSLASSSILAHLTVAKVVDATPVERIGKQLARHGADIASSTLNDWYAAAGKAAMLVQKHAHAELLKSTLISLDDTPMPTKNLEHEKNIQRGRIWLYLGDFDRIAYCQFTPDWKGKHPCRVLDMFSGTIQGDGYGGIDRLFVDGSSPPTKGGCNDHCRRKFIAALQMHDARAKPMIELYQRLYQIERQARDTMRDPDARLALRQAESVPIWQKMVAYIESIQGGVHKKELLGKAITYWNRQQPALKAFLSRRELPISNAHVERLLRTVALLRKNALFVGSLEAGPRYAALLTLAMNCVLADVNVFDYFSTFYDRVAAGWPASRAQELLPQAWATDFARKKSH